MNILITHGYLLSGTGSNIYVQNLVRTLVGQGHDVCLLCQDPDAGQLDFVQDVCIFSADNRSFEIAERKTTTCPGQCNVFIPNIGGLLPVYAMDPYPGFDVKIFPDCTDEEIDAYINFNQEAIETLLEHFQIDVIQTNHIIMFPHIVQQIAEAIRPPYFVKVHGSALNLSVKVQKRLVPYAISGLYKATKLFVNSEYAYREFVDFLEQKENLQLTDRIHILPAGVNVEQFVFYEDHRTASTRCQNFVDSMLVPPGGRSPATTKRLWAQWKNGQQPTATVLRTLQDSYDYRKPDENIQDILQDIAWGEDPVIYFIGKYLWTKGIQLILLAVPLVLEKWPQAQFVFTGFGPFRETAEFILQCLADRNYVRLLDDCEVLVGARGTPLPYFVDNLANLRSKLEELDPKTSERMWSHVHFTGIMNHEEIKHLLPAVDALVAPSVFPESFGMVAIEAMACGVPPILTYQSSFREMSTWCIEASQNVGLAMREVPLGPAAAEAIADNILTLLRWSRAPENAICRQSLRLALRQVVEERYSWNAVARHYVSHWDQRSNEAL